jgi:hypothetical protein
MKHTLLLLLLVLLLFCRVAHSQYSGMRSESDEIAEMEKKSRARLFQKSGVTMRSGASDNFDVNYYRCEWEVDPAVHAIAGKVTTYFKMVTAGSDIILDLADNLTVTAVKRANVPLTFSRGANSLTITLPAPLAAGALDSVEVIYQGTPAANGSFVTATHGAGFRCYGPSANLSEVWTGGPARTDLTTRPIP